MPGIIGFVTKQDNNNEKLLTSMAHSLEPDDIFQVDLFQEGEVGLGRVSLGIVNPETQPIWNEDKSLCIVMEGEIYDYQAEKQHLLDCGHRFQINNDTEFVLHLYEEYGEDFALRLNGAFVIAIWDQRSNKLLIANDRIGQYPLYYTQHNGSLFFASGLRALLSIAALPRDIDQIAIAQFLTFNHLLEDRTLLVGIHRLPPASLLIYSDHQMSLRSYWKMEHPKDYALRSEQEWMEALLFHLNQAISRQAQDSQPSGLLLSGGLDSRIILAFLGESSVNGKFNTFTWGIPGCDDAQFAKELSKKMGVNNHFFELRPDWLLNNAEEGVRITDGMGNIIALHAMANLEDEIKYARVIYKGFMGDGMMGYSLKHHHWADYNETSRMIAHLQVHREQGAIIFESAEQEKLFTPEFRNQVGDSVFKSYRAAMSETESTLLADQRNVYGLRQRVPRMALNGVEVVRRHAFVRLPFCDNDLVEFSLSIPPGLRYRRRLIKNAFIKAYPHLAQVPVTETGLPMMECARDVMLRADGVIRWHLRKVGFSQVSYPRKRHYQDYNTWFRTVLRSWVEENLLSAQVAELGYFEPEYIKNLLSDHMTGSNHAGRIGVLLSIVLWHKQFVN